MDTAAALRSAAGDYGEISTLDAIQIPRSTQKPKNPDDIGSHITSSKASVTMSSARPSSIAKAKATIVYGKERDDAEDGENNLKCARQKNGEKIPVKKCSYKDYSHVRPRGPLSLYGTANSTNKQHKFPAKLHAVLSNPAFENVLCWMPHGRSWKITQPGVFEEKLLPHLFGHCHLNSFMRQVNGWGFRRIKSGRDYNSYYHELFLRGMPHLLDQMRRESVREKKRRCSRDGENARDCTPDLYKISKKNPLPENTTDPPEPPLSFKEGHIDIGVSVGSKALIPPEIATLGAAPQQLQSATPHTFICADGAREIAQSVLRRDNSVVDSMGMVPSRSLNSQSMGLLGIAYPTERWPRSEERLTTMENRLIGLLAQEQQSLSRIHAAASSGLDQGLGLRTEETRRLRNIPISVSSAVDQDVGLRTQAPRSLSNIPIGASSAVDSTLGFRTEAAPWLDPRFDLQRSRLGGANPAESPNTRVFLSDAEYYRLKADRWPRL